MEEDAKKIADSIGKLTNEIVEARKKIAELEDANKVTGEELQKHRAISEDYAASAAKMQDVEALQKEMDNLQARFEKSKTAQEEAGVDSTEHKDSLMDLAANNYDLNKVKPETREFFESPEYRIMTETVDPAGGYLVTPEMDQTIIKNVTQIDQMRTIARVQSIGTSSFKQPKETTAPTAYWTDEETAPTESTPVIGMWTIPVHDVGVQIKVTRDWLMDTFTNADQYLAETSGRAIGYAEGTAFVTGNGVGKPFGFLTNHGTDAALYPADVSGKGTAVLSGDDFSELAGALKREYWDGSTFVMNQNTLADTMQLKTATSNTYIWQAGLQGGFPGVILGRPYAIMPTMEDQSDGSYPVAYGNFNLGYTIVDRIGTFMVKDDTSSFPKVVNYILKRVGGRVVLPEAIKVLEVT